MRGNTKAISMQGRSIIGRGVTAKANETRERAEASGVHTQATRRGTVVGKVGSRLTAGAKAKVAKKISAKVKAMSGVSNKGGKHGGLNRQANKSQNKQNINSGEA